MVRPVRVALTIPQARALWAAASRGIDELEVEIDDGLADELDRLLALRALDRLTFGIREAGADPLEENPR